MSIVLKLSPACACLPEDDGVGWPPAGGLAVGMQLQYFTRSGVEKVTLPNKSPVG